MFSLVCLWVSVCEKMISSVDNGALVMFHSETMLEHAGKKATLISTTRIFRQRVNRRFMEVPGIRGNDLFSIEQAIFYS